mgnify:CR=1 FL=1
MEDEIPSLENFAVTLEKLKLPKTALIFREELEKKNNMQKIEKTLSSNPLVSILMKKLEAPKIISSKKNFNKKEESKEDPLLSLNLSSKMNNSLLETKIFKKLYENFDTQKIGNKPSDNIISSKDKEETKEKEKEKKQQKINTSEILSNSTINNENKNNSILNTTNNNEEDSIFTNANASNMDDSNATQFNPPPKKLNPRRKNQDKRAEKSYAGNAQLDKMLKISQIKFNQSGSNIDNSSFFMNSRVDPNNTKEGNNILNQSEIDEYVDDDDPGFDLFECDRIYQDNTSKQLAEQYGYPERAVFKSKYKNLLSYNKNEKHRSRDDTVENSKSNLPEGVKFMKSYDPYYPIINNNVILDSFELKVIMNREKIGYEPEKELKFKKDELIAGRYQYQRELGDAAFSTAVQCLDIKEKRLVCIKIIKNNKDYFDQSIDEIKLLRYINANGDPDKKYFLRVYDYFYYKEHLMIVSELLKDNLYDFYKYLTDNNNTEYFSVERIQKLTKQILICLDFIHDLKIIHCDLKPENILMKSITDATCKVIDFGSSCFVHDHLSAYIQSRSYRAPEVILGCRYDYKIDMWSLGCILAEIYTGNVLFQNDSIQSMLARIIGICGPIPNWMYEKGKLVNDFFTKEKLLYMEPNAVDNNESMNQTSPQEKGKKVHILVPKRSSLRKRIRTNNEQFFNFLSGLLKIDPNDRMSAKEALNHPFIKNIKI